ncbi:MAG: hypothetical protein AMXMBFR84_42750 [Candidatus Hydrogenedentota bacterium]
MSKYAILIAVENYSDTSISSVDYAEADALGLSTALEQHGFDKTEQVLLLSNKATKTSIESQVGRRVRSLTAGDTLCFYYAGHGFAKNGENYITCHDTDVADLERTSVPVQWLFDLFRNSLCNKVMLFLDSCESGILASTKVRGIYTDLTERELEEFFDKSEHCVCFTACKPDESSYPSRLLNHGIWTYHIIQALNGEAPLALERGHLLTSSSLQNFLKQEVPRSLRQASPDVRHQTPWLYGAQSSEFLIADVKHILEARRSAAMPHMRQLKRIVLRGVDALSIVHLSGFNKKKGHFIPDSDSESAQSFVARIAQEELEQDLEDKYASIKEAFGLKRRDIRTDGPEEGSGSIITPDFNYVVTVQINPDDTSEALWYREIESIRTPDAVLSPEFERAFGDIFTVLEFVSDTLFDIADIVDQIEDLNDGRLTVDTDKDCSFCTLQVDGLDVTIRITANSFQIEQGSGRSTKDLIEGFFDAQKVLVNEHKLKQLPFSGHNV